MPLGLKIAHENLSIFLPTFRRPDAVYLKLDIFESELRQYAKSNLKYLRIKNRIRLAENIKIRLPVFTITPLLRAVIPKERSCRKELHRFRQGLHAMLDIRASNTRGKLRPKRCLVAAARLEEVYFFVDNVRPRSNRADEEVRIFDRGRIDPMKTKFLTSARQKPANSLPIRLFLRQDVSHAAERLQEKRFFLIFRRS